MGAASKGIIQRDHQHNAVVYKSLYSPNPFENISEEELARYKEKVEGKTKGEPGKWPFPLILKKKNCGYYRIILYMSKK